MGICHWPSVYVSIKKFGNMIIGVIVMCDMLLSHVLFTFGSDCLSPVVDTGNLLTKYIGIKVIQ